MIIQHICNLCFKWRVWLYVHGLCLTSSWPPIPVYRQLVSYCVHLHTQDHTQEPSIAFIYMIVPHFSCRMGMVVVCKWLFTFVRIKQGRTRGTVNGRASLARQTFEGGRERLVTIASNPWTVGMLGIFIIKISTRKINSSRMRHMCISEQWSVWHAKLKDCRWIIVGNYTVFRPSIIV